MFSASLCQSVMNMMHVISIPYALMKVNPLSWIQKVCQYKGKQIDPNSVKILSIITVKSRIYVAPVYETQAVFFGVSMKEKKFFYG